MRLLTILLSLASLAVAEAVEFRIETLAGQPVTVCTVRVKTEPLELFLRDEHGQTFKKFERLDASLRARGRKLVFAANAGMYHADFSPVGLFVAGGRQLAPLNLAMGEGNFFLKPNGVFLITAAGAQVLDSTAMSNIREPIELATQSGPLLVSRGRIHPAFNAASTSRLLRNGVGVPSPDIAVFAIAEGPVNFYEFATFFRDRLKCPDALFLDGTISSLHSTALKRSDVKIDLGPIIGITEKLP